MAIASYIEIRRRMQCLCVEVWNGEVFFVNVSGGTLKAVLGVLRTAGRETSAGFCATKKTVCRCKQGWSLWKESMCVVPRFVRCSGLCLAARAE